MGIIKGYDLKIEQHSSLDSCRFISKRKRSKLIWNLQALTEGRTNPEKNLTQGKEFKFILLLGLKGQEYFHLHQSTKGKLTMLFCYVSQYSGYLRKKHFSSSIVQGKLFCSR